MCVSLLPLTFLEFKLEVQPAIAGRFAPEGQNVYSLAVVSLLRSSVGAQSLLSASTKVLLPGFAPSGAISLRVRS